MTERIQALADEAEDYADAIVDQGGEFHPAYTRKLAKLIVRETIKQMAIQMDKFGDDQSNNPAWYKSEEAVKKHFGVEE